MFLRVKTGATIAGPSLTNVRDTAFNRRSYEKEFGRPLTTPEAAAPTLLFLLSEKLKTPHRIRQRGLYLTSLHFTHIRPVLSSAILKYSLSFSIPMNLQPSFLAATTVELVL